MSQMKLTFIRFLKHIKQNNVIITSAMATENKQGCFLIFDK